MKMTISNPATIPATRVGTTTKVIMAPVTAIDRHITIRFGYLTMLFLPKRFKRQSITAAVEAIAVMNGATL
jgi:hypothetical protein